MEEIKKEEIKKVTFGKYYSIYNMPCITLVSNYHKDWDSEEVIMLPEGEEEIDGYLCSFRNYAFQVCGTYNGQWDKGSTPVFGLDTFGSIKQRGNSNLSQESTVKYIIGAVAIDAVNNFMRGRIIEDGAIGPKHDYHHFGGNKEWEKFIDNVYRKYVLNEPIDDVPLQEEDVEEAI